MEQPFFSHDKLILFDLVIFAPKTTKPDRLLAIFALTQWMRPILFVASLLGAVSTGHAQTLLFDGGFESGTLIGWVPGNQGSAIVAAKGRCFSDQDTSALSIRGRYAGLLRGTKKLEQDAAATLTSKPFTAGKGFLFLAMTEQHVQIEALDRPYTLMVSVIDSNGATLSLHAIETATISLSPGCPSLPRNQRFSEHFIGTQKYQGQTIKIRFSQHPAIAHSGNFSLIDQVSIVQAGEIAAYTKKPIAIAGIQYEAEEDTLYLIAKIPDALLEESRGWLFNWHIDGEVTTRSSFKACINDLKPGNHTANLLVQKADTLASDTLHFFVPDRSEQKSIASKFKSQQCRQQASSPEPASIRPETTLKKVVQ